VLAEGWEQREAFIDRLSQTLDGIPQRRAYYPGARDRHAAFVQGRQNVRLLGTASPDSLPWAIIRGLDSSNKNELCFTKEAFCSILGETTLPAKDPVDFIRQATAFCNDVTWGTLNVSLIVHPSIEATSEGKAAVEAAIQSLRYGTIAINHWGALGYGFVSTPWGGHSGATVDNVQSGIGWVHNSYMIEDIQKSVVRGPFVVNPRPAWFRTNRRTNLIGRKMVGFESRPSVWKLPGVVLEALRG
jgi:aldehyde dehydrogenase (NAD(P)+)